MRLAFFSPLPPAATGIAEYSADLLAILSEGHEIDAFHDQESIEPARLPEGCGLHRAAAFPDRHRQRPYDLTVYQMGNGRDHAFLYDHLSRVPGLLVLHDLVLHHSRAAQFLEAEPVRAWRLDPGSAPARAAAQPWLDAWREELRYTYPERGERLFQAQLGTVGDLLPYAYPLLRLPVEASRAVAVHSRYAAEAVREEVPSAEVVRVPMSTSAREVDRSAVDALRRRLGFEDHHLVIGTFGLLTPEKRIDAVARAVVRAAAWNPDVRLLLAGPAPDGARLEALVDRLGAAARTVITGRVALDELPVHIQATDIVVQLRYPTARETSAALLRVLAQGRATVISDLAHQDGIPADAVVRADVTDEEGELTRALLQLGAHPGRRADLGRRAAAYVAREHSPAAVRAAWEGALERARRHPARPPGDWPTHWPRP